MNLLHLLRPLPLALVCALSVVHPSFAQASGPIIGTIVTPAADQLNSLVATLRKSGYRIIEIRKTFLGRLRIRAENGLHLREIVVSQSTGEIKHDAVIKVFATPGTDPQGTQSDHTLENGRTIAGTTSSGFGPVGETASTANSGSGASVSTTGSSASVSAGGTSASVSVGDATVSAGGTSVSADSDGVSVGD